MIRKLRRKFMFAAMGSLLVVLLLIEGIAAGLNYYKISTDADRILGVLKENEGRFPLAQPPEKPGKEKGPMDGGWMTPELPYESRYFSVVFDQKGTVISTDTGKIAGIDPKEAAEYGKQVMESGKERGFIGIYRYGLEDSKTQVRVIFLDCRRNLSTFHHFLLDIVAVTLVGLLAVFVLLFCFSARIVKPFSENYEKQKRFITDAGHELKTPLTIIDADAQVLEMDVGENEWLKDIQTQTGRLAELTNQLILLSRMEEEQAKTIWTDVLLSDVAEETVGTFRSLAMTQEKVLESQIEPLLSIKGDEKAIRRLLGILLDNAVKYTEKNGRIQVTLERQKKRIRLSVFNTTKEITRQQTEHLLERFYRTDTSRNSETGGYGLGLSIAAATVEAHKGKITVSTEDEKSLRVTVTFPISK